MGNKIKQEMNKIEVPKELSERSKIGVSQAKKEMKKDRKKLNVKGIGIAVALLLSIGAYTLYTNISIPNNTPVVMKGGGVKIPALQLPKNSSSSDMIGLIVYQGNIYTETGTKIDVEDAKKIMGEKLGTTKGTIDEWSKRSAYGEELASTIGITDIYSVQGYNKSFRIMVYEEQGDELYAEFYENLNGLTINSGKDVFGELNMAGNVAVAKWQTASDWYNGIENYHLIQEIDIVNRFVDELARTKPLLRKEASDPIWNAPNSDEIIKKLLIHLKDGSEVSLTLLKDGYIYYYGFMDVYFQMDEDIFSKMWSQLE